ncbi:MAG: hypothetical protein JJT76_04745 [Clostridiaceae bacterium]|nr:hypothetical protein [Clostridiaceae bacterium]
MGLKKLALFCLITIFCIYSITACNSVESNDHSINTKTEETEELREKLIGMDLEQIQEGELIKYEEVTVLHLPKSLQNYIVFSIKEEKLAERTRDIHVSFGDRFEGLPHKVGITAVNDLTIIAYETKSEQKRQIDKFYFRDENKNVIYQKIF